MYRQMEYYGLTRQFLCRTIKYAALLTACFIGVFWVGKDVLDAAIEDADMRHRFTDVLFFAELVLVFTAYILLMIRFLLQQQKYIAYLIDSVKLMRGGNFGRPTEILGNNELSSLATYIDELRKAVAKDRQIEISKQEKEQQLITSISHDLRTPLTSLIGYLEILQDADLHDGAKRKRYLDHCMERALQLQDLTNTTFEHFYLSTKEQRNIELLRCNSFSNLLLMLEKRVESLEQNGYRVFLCPPCCQYSLIYDTRMMERLFDNVFTNIVRYADKQKPIFVEGDCVKDKLTLTIKNSIGHTNPTNQSTGIGLKNCRQIMTIHGGEFHSEMMEDDYLVRIEFPIQNEV